MASLRKAAPHQIRIARKRKVNEARNPFKLPLCLSTVLLAVMSNFKEKRIKHIWIIIISRSRRSVESHIDRKTADVKFLVNRERSIGFEKPNNSSSSRRRSRNKSGSTLKLVHTFDIITV